MQTMYDRTDWMRQANIISEVLSKAPDFDKDDFRISTSEYIERQNQVSAALNDNGFDCGIVYSDEHYCGDVPYLGGNTNISIEPVAGIISKKGFFLLAGLEGGYVAEQLAYRSNCKVFKVDMLKLADEEYPIDAVNIDDVFVAACGEKPKKIALLTPRSVLPVSIHEYLCNYIGSDNVHDSQELYYKCKYEKSQNEMTLIEEACRICDVMIEGMLSILRPGLYETQVAAWGYNIALELGAEDMGFDIMVTAGESNRSLIGKALNRRICEGDIVQIGVAPKRDGLTACERVSVVCVKNRSLITPYQKYWFDFIEDAYQCGLDAYIHVAQNELPAWHQEQSLIDYFHKNEKDVYRLIGKEFDFVKQKPYTGTHNAGYTECQEFYGAITLNSMKPLGNRIVTMLDVAVKGHGNMWNDVIIPGIDYILVEKTLGKFGKDVRVMTRLPVNVQDYVGKGF